MMLKSPTGSAPALLLMAPRGAVMCNIVGGSLVPLPGCCQAEIRDKNGIRKNNDVLSPLASHAHSDVTARPATDLATCSGTPWDSIQPMKSGPSPKALINWSESRSQ